MPEKNPNFTIQGTNSEGDFKITPEKFLKISNPKPGKVIVLGKITEGTIFKGDKINFSLGEEILTDTVRSIEKDRKEITPAVKNEEIGICLSKTKLRELRKFNKG